MMIYFNLLVTTGFISNTSLKYSEATLTWPSLGTLFIDILQLCKSSFIRLDSVKCKLGVTDLMSP